MLGKILWVTKAYKWTPALILYCKRFPGRKEVRLARLADFVVFTFLGHHIYASGDVFANGIRKTANFNEDVRQECSSHTRFSGSGAH